jgi:hypothetical protein
MHTTHLIEQLRWYLGRDDVDVDARSVRWRQPLALIGGDHDDVDGFADRIAAERPVLDLDERTPTLQEVRRLFGEHPETIVLASRAERVIEALGLVVQPWYMAVSPLSARPHEALDLLREAIVQLGVRVPLEALGEDGLAGLTAYDWPRGLREIREAARRFAAYLDSGGDLGVSARSLDVSRQALSKYLNRRVAAAR